MKPISGFVEKCCLFARNARVSAVELYLAYVQWCLESGVPVQDQFTFVDMIECYGVSCQQRKRGAWFHGLAVLPAYRVTQ